MRDDEIERCDPDWVCLAVFPGANCSDQPMELRFKT